MDDRSNNVKNHESPVPGKAIRSRFPIFSKRSERPLAYLDSAASSQKPGCVIERLSNYLSFEHANIHRGAYELSAASTRNYEASREALAAFIASPNPRQIIFTKGATEAINLAAHSLEEQFQTGDAILLTLLEHHSNIVPWQLLAKRKGLRIVFAGVRPDASLDEEDFLAKLEKERPKLAAFTMLANSFGTVLPVERLVSACGAAGAWTLLDAAQGAPHREINVQKLGCDFLAVAGHKMYGPTGIGALYSSARVLERMEPFQGGGDMIDIVTTEGSTWAEPPQKFEAGTPPIAEAIALAPAVALVQEVGFSSLSEHEAQLFRRAFDLMSRERGVTVYGPALSGKEQSSIIAFNVEGVHPHDLATIADGFNVQIRAGNHCAMPALGALGLFSTARASMGMYSCMDDFEALLEAVRHARRVLA